MAARGGHKNIVEYLVDQKAEINVTDKYQVSYTYTDISVTVTVAHNHLPERMAVWKSD